MKLVVFLIKSLMLFKISYTKTISLVFLRKQLCTIIEDKNIKFMILNKNRLIIIKLKN